ncbi:MAG TPA: hypothetical protein VNP20_21560 [Nocardioidaceae bacterium]|nr:hypothetical protein [Nocardioidaceae bacterium]
MDTFPRMMRRWLSQDVARLNAAQASRRMLAQRRERESVDSYVTERITVAGGLHEGLEVETRPSASQAAQAR